MTTQVNTNTAATDATNVPVATDTISGDAYQKVLQADPVTGVAFKPAAESTQQAISDKLLAPIAASLTGLEFGQPVRQIPASLVRCSFADVGAGLLASEVVQVGSTGTGMTVNQSAGSLVITTGTTANSEFLARTATSVKGAHVFRASVILSQRIANNNFSIEVADQVGTGLSFTINSATSVTVTFPVGTSPWTSANVGQGCNLSAISGAAGVPMRGVIASVSGDTVTFTVAGWPASGSGTLTLWGWNYHRCLFNGTTATSALYDAQRKGWNSGDTTVTISTTASPGVIIHGQSDGSDASIADSLRASSTSYNFTTRGTRLENLPDPTTALYLWVRAWNGTTNPASTTTFTVGFISLEDIENIKVAISGATRNGAGNAVPARIVDTPAVTISGNPTLAALPTGTNLIGDLGLQYRAGSTGAASKSHRVSTGTDSISVKASAGKVVGWRVANTNAAFRYVKLHNTAGAVTAGSGVVETIPVPPNSTVFGELPGGSIFSTGIGFSMVTGAVDSDATAVAANDLILDLFYA